MDANSKYNIIICWWLTDIFHLHESNFLGQYCARYKVIARVVADILKLLLLSVLWQDVGNHCVSPLTSIPPFNTLRPRQNGRHFVDDIFKCIFLNETFWIPIKTSMKFVPNSSINNIPTLVQIMGWRRSGDKPLSEPMMVSLLTHICVTRPQWVKVTQ